MTTARAGMTVARRHGMGAAAETPGGAQIAADTTTSTRPASVSITVCTGGLPGSTSTCTGRPAGLFSASPEAAATQMLGPLNGKSMHFERSFL